MATPFKGIKGSVSLTGTYPAAKIANIKNWSLTVDVASLDTTAFGDTNTSATMGLRNATCQISGDLSTEAGEKTMLAQVSNAGTLAPMILRLVASTYVSASDNGSYWYATGAQLTNIQVGSEVAGIASFSASFQLSGGAKYPSS
jgi:hypothetical protein